MIRISEVRDPLQGITIGMDSKHEVLTDFPTVGYTAISISVDETTVTVKDADGNENVLVDLPIGFIGVLGSEIVSITTNQLTFIS